MLRSITRSSSNGLTSLFFRFYRLFPRSHLSRSSTSAAAGTRRELFLRRGLRLLSALAAVSMGSFKLGCERVLVVVAGKDVFGRQGLAYAAKLEKSGWKGDLKVVEEEDEGHCFHLRNPNSENDLKLMKTFVAFIITSSAE